MKNELTNRLFRAITLLCLLHVVSIEALYANIDPSATIGGNCIIGYGCEIDKGVFIGDNALIGDYVKIAKDVNCGTDLVVSNWSVIDSGVVLGDRVVLGSNVTINRDVQIGSEVEIGDGTLVERNTIIRDGAIIGAGVIIERGVTVLKGAEILDGALITKGATEPAQSVTGVAAAGAPVVGIINMKGANGATASSSIEVDGSYSIDVTDLTVPYILYAEGIVNGKSIAIYSSGFGSEINITPVTDFILRNALSNQAETAWDSWGTDQVDATALENAETLVQEQLSPLLNAMGVDADVDLITTPFQVDHTGMDLALEAIDISYEGNVAIVTNNLTGASFTDDITDPTTNYSLPASDEVDTQFVLTDNEAINQVWQILVDLYAESLPSNAELATWFDTYVSADFVDNGSTKTNKFDSWKTGDGPPVGFSLSSAIVEPMDIANTIYTKGYRIRLYYASQESDPYFMVFDGTNWFWHGNQMWVYFEFRAHANMTVDWAGNATFHTGLGVTLWDSRNYAHDQGAQSAIVTGPGFPVEGQVLAHYFPEPFFRLYPSGDWSYWLNDNAISTISNNAVYTFNLYAGAPEVVSLNDTPLWSYTKTIPKGPVLNSELDASLFPALITPNSHDESVLNVPGLVSVNWANPSNMKIDYLNLGLHSPDWSSGYMVDARVASGDTSATLDTTDLPLDVLANQLYLHGEDTYERRFGFAWQFFFP